MSNPYLGGHSTGGSIMQRISLLTVAVAVVAGGCAQAPTTFEPPQKPHPARQMARLERMLGQWSVTGQMTSPSPEELKEITPEGEEPMDTTFQGGNHGEWTLGGMFLKNTGWHEMGEGQTAEVVEYVTWDPKAGKYRTWWFSDWGEHGDGWITISPDGKTMHYTANTVDTQGRVRRGLGTLNYVADDTLEWVWSEDGPEGKMEFKGTSKRQP
jgi:hypothetical protein